MQDKFGLKESDLLELHSIFTKYPEIEKVIIFGSRAQGNHKQGSDVDIALIGHGVANILAKVWGELEDETKMPYFFDLVDYINSDIPIKNHIDEFGKELYVKAEML